MRKKLIEEMGKPPYFLMMELDSRGIIYQLEEEVVEIKQIIESRYPHFQCTESDYPILYEIIMKPEIFSLVERKIKSLIKKCGSLELRKLYDLLLMSAYIHDGTLVPATKEEYQKWLEGYLKRGRKPTHFYRFPFSDDKGEIYEAIKNFEMRPLYGRCYINIIIPEDVEVKNVDNCGHNDLFFMKNFESSGKVPVYEDIKFDDESLNKILEKFKREYEEMTGLSRYLKT